MAAAEQAREQLAEAGVDPVERLFEALAGLLVDLADRRLQRLQRGVEVSQLRVEVGLALRLLLVLGDRREVDRLEPLDLRVERGQLLLPFRWIAARG